MIKLRNTITGDEIFTREYHPASADDTTVALENPHMVRNVKVETVEELEHISKSAGEITLDALGYCDEFYRLDLYFPEFAKLEISPSIIQMIKLGAF